VTIIEDCDYFIRLIPLPGSVGGMVTPNNDGTVMMYLNEAHSGELLIDDYMHEYEHIENDDLYGDKSIRLIEKRGA